MKILFVTHMLFPEHVGGREKYVVRLAEEWSSAHQVGIVCYTRQRDQRKSLMQARIYAVRLLPKPLLVSQIILIIAAVIATLVDRYDIIYVNSSTAPQFAGFFCKMLTRKPYVVAIHNPRELTAKSLPRLSSHIKKMILRNASHTIAVSKELMKLLLGYAFISKDKVSFIPPGVEQELFEYQQDSCTEEGGVNARSEGAAPIVITSRRLVKEKGVDTLLRAVKILHDDGFLVKCVIVGTGPELNQLSHLSDELEIETQVTFAGLIMDEQLRKLISSADCCVIPSRREGTPVALFEYMALGKPVVATQVGGVKDVLPNKELIVRPNDPAALADKIRAILENETFAIEVGMKNREIARQYTWTRIASEILAVFEAIS